jgi:hypothetical protein
VSTVPGEGQVLRFGWRGCMAVHDIAAGERRSAEEAETQCQGDGDEGLLHGLLRSLQRVADATDNADQTGQSR